jgi:hypothetical protein
VLGGSGIPVDGANLPVDDADIPVDSDVDSKMFCVTVLKVVDSAGSRVGDPSSVTCAGIEDVEGIEDVVVAIDDSMG